jgi:hypothetical protein
LRCNLLPQGRNLRSMVVRQRRELSSVRRRLLRLPCLGSRTRCLGLLSQRCIRPLRLYQSSTGLLCLGPRRCGVCLSARERETGARKLVSEL